MRAIPSLKITSTVSCAFFVLVGASHTFAGTPEYYAKYMSALDPETAVIATIMFGGFGILLMFTCVIAIYSSLKLTQYPIFAWRLSFGSHLVLLGTLLALALFKPGTGIRGWILTTPTLVCCLLLLGVRKYIDHLEYPSQ